MLNEKEKLAPDREQMKFGFDNNYEYKLYGAFSGERKSGSTVIWKLTGSFATKTTAHAKATLHSVCDGGTVKLTLTLVHH